MSCTQSYTRINTLEIKGLIVKKIGHERADTYFDQLTRLFSYKISKSEFDKFCAKIIGRENIPLHNRLIRSIVKNACLSKSPPPKVKKRVESSLDVKSVNGYQRNCLQSLYGDAFPPSPRKGRSPVNRDRKFRDRPSPLGPHGKPQNMVCEELNSREQEQQSATELLSLGSRPPVEVASVEEGEEVDQAAGSPGVQSRTPVTAPLGVSMNFGGARKSLLNVSLFSNQLRDTCLNNGVLPDTRSLRNRLEQKLEMEGLSVSLECADVLNNAVDMYLKRLIEPCIGLASSRNVNVQFASSGFNGTFPGSHMHRSTESVCASMLDFHAAMELNPQILGKDWPTSLEKLSFRAFEE
ncbi:uncharacterized protein LOC126659662 [Mercurialis annua]|uniref:uncharacterized protein LOC126659662 n=1 Tax=Mercurialis annua TaxID=3986 RepID=UPI00216088D5|nr:uncharacterized protein LOC126659662 [Mercurialis annua]